MGTPATIALLNEDGRVLGARVNYDGYPSHIGPFLTTVLSRLDGSVERLMTTLVAGIEWSSLDADQEITSVDLYREVEGIGEAYPADDAWGPVSGALDEALGEDFAYIFSADCSVLKVYVGSVLVFVWGVVDLGSVDWGNVPETV